MAAMVIGFTPETEAQMRLECETNNSRIKTPTGAYCPGLFDGWACWYHTPANTTAYAPCPPINHFDPKLHAHKECMGDGTWYKHPDTGRAWSNYTTCVVEDAGSMVVVHEIGYSISLVALLLALFILLYFRYGLNVRSLRCARITVHMNLFASFVLNNIVWLLWYELVVNEPTTMRTSPIWCRLLYVMRQYVLMTNYTWMLCEGLYLHTVLVHAFVSERRLLLVLIGVGWVLPIPFAVGHAARRATADDALCWSEGEDTLWPELAVVALTAIVLNLGFLCNIVRVLCTKLRAGGMAAATRPSATALHALRATCLLAPLLGVQYLLQPSRPEKDTGGWWQVYEYVSALMMSLQGLCVATLYCFCNGEVVAQVRRRWRIITFRPRANSTTITTVSFKNKRKVMVDPETQQHGVVKDEYQGETDSCCLYLFVRSGAGTEGDKV